MSTTRALENSEIQAMFAHISERHAVRNRAMLTVGIHLALRASEICGLSVGDVYDSRAVRNYVTIRAAIAKGKRSRIIRMGDEIKWAMADYIAWKQKAIQSIAPDAPLFVSQKGGHVSRITLFNVVKKLLVKAGINQSPHCLRKTGTTLYYEHSGYDLIATQEFLGHADPSVTRRYIGITARQRFQYAQRASKALVEAIETGVCQTLPTKAELSGLSDEDRQRIADELAHKNRTIETLIAQIDRLTSQSDRLTRMLERKDDQRTIEQKAAQGGAKVIMIDHVRHGKRG